MVIEIDLNKDSSRPMMIIETDTGGHINCLISTGATIPIWYDEIDVLKAMFPSAKRIDNVVGDEANNLSEVWEIPILSLKDRNGNGTLTFNNVPIAIATLQKESFSMILPTTMFSNMKYKFFNIKDKHLEIEFESNNFDMPTIGF